MPRGKRDRAVLALGFVGAYRRSELVVLNLADLKFGPRGIKVLISGPKMDQEGRGQQIAIPEGDSLRSVQAVRDWLDAEKIEKGPVFRRVTQWDRVRDEA